MPAVNRTWAIAESNSVTCLYVVLPLLTKSSDQDRKSPVKVAQSLSPNSLFHKSYWIIFPYSLCSINHKELRLCFITVHHARVPVRLLSQYCGSGRAAGGRISGDLPACVCRPSTDPGQVSLCFQPQRSLEVCAGNATS